MGVWITFIIQVFEYFINEVQAMLSWDFANFSDTIIGVSEKLHAAIVPVGEAFCLIFFLVGLAKELEHVQEIRPSFLVKNFLRLFVVYILVELSWDFMNWFWKVGIGLVKVIASVDTTPQFTLVSSEAIPTDAFANLTLIDTSEIGLITAIPDALAAISKFIAEQIPGLIMTIITAVVLLVVGFAFFIYMFARILRIMLSVILAPIGLSFFASEPTSRTSITFMKTFIGDCLFGMVVMIILQLYQTIINFDIFKIGGDDSNPILSLAQNALGASSALGQVSPEMWAFCIQMLLKAILLAIMLFGARNLIKEKLDM